MDDFAIMKAALKRFGLLSPGEEPRFFPLTGGVSSDIWRVDLVRGPVCIKRALPRLKVSADWHAPVERNACEVAWIRSAAAVVPEAVPRLLGHDPDAGLFAMEYLDPVRYRVWKTELREGRVDARVVQAVGERLVRVKPGPPWMRRGKPDGARLCRPVPAKPRMSPSFIWR